MVHVTLAHVSPIHSMMAQHVHVGMHMGVHTKICQLLSRKRGVHVVHMLMNVPLVAVITVQVLLQGRLLMEAMPFFATTKQCGISSRPWGML